MSYHTGDADGAFIYNDGLTSKKDQRILVVGFNDVIISPEEIATLESVSPEDKAMARKISYNLAAQFNTRASMNCKCRNKFMGVALSFTAEEREMLESNPQLMDDIVQDWLDGMGFKDAQYFAVYHYDTNCPHIHLYVNMVGRDFKAYKSYQTKYRSQQVNRSVEEKYGLKPGLGIDENYKSDRMKTNPREMKRREIFEKLSMFLDYYGTDTDILKEWLKTYNIEMKIVTHENGKKGFVFNDFTGTQIGRRFTYKNLMQELEQNAVEKKELEGLAVRVLGLPEGSFDLFKAPPFEEQDEKNKKKAVRRRKYKKDGFAGTIRDKDKNKYYVYRTISGKYFVSDNEKDSRQRKWMSLDGCVLSHKEFIQYMVDEKLGKITALTNKKPVPRSVSTVSAKPKHGNGIVAGHTQRSNADASKNKGDIDYGEQKYKGVKI